MRRLGLTIILIVGVILIGIGEITTQIIWKIQDFWGFLREKCNNLHWPISPGF